MFRVAVRSSALRCRAAAARGPTVSAAGRVRWVGETSGLPAINEMGGTRVSLADPLKDGSAAEIQTEIGGYSQTGFTINSVVVPGPVLLLTHASFFFEVSSPADLTPRSLEVLSLLRPPIELLVIGTGRQLTPLPPEVDEWLMSRCIMPEVSPTRDALSTFNFMVGEGRQVAAVLFPHGHLQAQGRSSS